MSQIPVSVPSGAANESVFARAATNLQLRQLGDIRDPSRRIFRENLEPISQMHKLGKRTDMIPDTVTLIIWLIAGVAGGSAVGDLLKGFDLGPLRNVVAGAVGGVIGAKLLELLFPALRGLDIVSVAGQAIVAAASGAAFTVVASTVGPWRRR